MNWIELTSESQLSDIVAVSETQPVIVFKHSTRCSISVAAKGRLERQWNFADNEITAYYLDLLNYRSISNKIADDFQVQYELGITLLGWGRYAEAVSCLRAALAVRRSSSPRFRLFQRDARSVARRLGR